MSLLNNALREAEERQRRPTVTGAYTGAVQEGRDGARWPLVLVGLLVLGLIAAGLYWWAMTGSVVLKAPETADGRALTNPDNGQIERSAPVVVAQPAAVPSPKPEPESAPASAPESEATVPAVAQPSAPQPAAPESPSPEPDEVRQVQAASSPEPFPEPPAPKSKSQSEPAPAQAMKTAPQNPVAIDRQSAKDFATLIASGRMVEAEARLTRLVEVQAAPLSRFTVARALLVEGDTQRALNWLPEAAAAGDPRLRMLRARAQHADGRLDAAVATLASNLPAVAELPEYRVTLATLLQQQGQGQKAAAQWAELIAWNDSRAPWWVGLAIALEAQGETRGATRAFEQAAVLPGLSPSLAEYVQRRLQSLRGG